MALDPETVKKILKKQHEEQRARDEHGRFAHIAEFNETVQELTKKKENQGPLIMGWDGVEELERKNKIEGLPKPGK